MPGTCQSPTEFSHFILTATLRGIQHDLPSTEEEEGELEGLDTVF